LRATPVSYNVQYPQVSELSDKDISIVKEVLDLNFKHPDAMMYGQIISKTKIAIEKKLGVKSEQHPLYFLDTVLKDYNFLHNE
jgi:hypothetical protein